MMKERRKTNSKNLPRRLLEALENDPDHAIALQGDQGRDLENTKEEFHLKIEITVIQDLLVINIPAAAEVIDQDLDQTIVTAAEGDPDPDLGIGAEEVTSPISVPPETVKDTENVIVTEIAIVIPDHTKDVRDHDHGRIHSEDLVRK